MALPVRVSIAVLFAGLVAVWGCDAQRRTAVAETTSWPPRTADDFVRAYRMAHARNDVQLALDLVCMDGVRDRVNTRSVFAEAFRDAFRQPLGDVRTEPRAVDQLTRYEHDGTTYRTNLEVIGNLVVESSSDRDSMPPSISFPIGRKDGVLFIVASVPVP